MSVKRPTLEQMSDIVESLGMTMTKERVGEFISLMDGNFAAYDLVDQMPDEIPVVKYPRTPGYRPSAEENPLNAWYVKTDIQGAPKGKLKGKTVAVKDNVCVAGVPMMNGSSTLEGYIPNIDATIVTRLLDAGAIIKGKAHCECFCLSGGSHTGALGPVHNPHKQRLFRGRIIVRKRRAGRGRRSRSRDRRRPGRVDPHAGFVLRRLRNEADPWPRALYRRHADRSRRSTTPARSPRRSPTTR